MSKARWCIRDRHDVWCAALDDQKPDESAGSVATLCQEYILFPHGIAKRRPTCPKCRHPQEPQP